MRLKITFWLPFIQKKKMEKRRSSISLIELITIVDLWIFLILFITSGKPEIQIQILFHEKLTNAIKSQNFKFELWI